MIGVNPYLREFGFRVKVARLRCGMKQTALADLIGLSAASVCNIEKGRQHLGLDTAVKIAQSLDVDLASLLPLSVKPNARPESPVE